MLENETNTKHPEFDFPSRCTAAAQRLTVQFYLANHFRPLYTVVYTHLFFSYPYLLTPVFRGASRKHFSFVRRYSLDLNWFGLEENTREESKSICLIERRYSQTVAFVLKPDCGYCFMPDCGLC